MNAPLRLQPPETPVLFGPGGRLMGVVTPAVPGSDVRIACLLLNVGVLHRIGPHRVNVKVARALAAQGITSMRFDLSGQGDSGPSRSQAHFIDQSVSDMRAAMDHLQATEGIDRFIVFGICSGAINGYALAQADPRVVGLLMFDGFTYESRASRIQRDLQRMVAIGPKAFFAKILRTVKRLAGGESARPGGIFDDGTSLPSMADFERAMNQLADRGVAVYLVYSGSLRPHDAHRAQLSAFGDAPFIRRIRYEFMADVDHFVTPLSSQRKLCASMCAWVQGIVQGSARPAH